MSLSSLKVLVDNRQALLLAEVAALLHDVGKCTSEFAYEPSARAVKQNGLTLTPTKRFLKHMNCNNTSFLRKGFKNGQTRRICNMLYTDCLAEFVKP